MVRDARGRIDRKNKRNTTVWTYISNNRFPAPVLEQGNDVLSRFDVTISVNTDVNESPFVKILDDGFKASQNARSDAG